MTTYPADAIETIKSVVAGWGVPLNDAEAVELAAAFDAAMLAKGWKRVPRETTRMMHEAGITAFQKPENKHGAVLDETFAAMWDNAPPHFIADDDPMYDAAPEVKP